jgi:hypothetical protein
MLSGTQYAFGIFSNLLKTHFSLSQTKLDNIGLMANIGGNFAVHAGVFFDLYGPKPTCLIAGIQGTIGFFWMWASVQFSLPMSSGGLMALSALQGHACAWTDVATIPLLATTFPNHKGTAIGFSKAFVGLAGAIFAQIYTGFFKPHVLSFLLLCGVAFASLSLIGFLVMNGQDKHPLVENYQQVADWFATAYRLMYVLAAYLMAAALTGQFVNNLPQSVEAGLTFGLFAFFAVLHTFLLTRRDGPEDEHEEQEEQQQEEEEEEEGKQEEQEGGGGLSASLLKKHIVRIGRIQDGAIDGARGGESRDHGIRCTDQTLGQAVRGAPFWIIFCALMFGCGSGLVVINVSGGGGGGGGVGGGWGGWSLTLLQVSCRTSVQLR